MCCRSESKTSVRIKILVKFIIFIMKFTLNNRLCCFLKFSELMSVTTKNNATLTAFISGENNITEH